MNSQAPDFISKVAGSSETTTTIEEHNAANLAVNLHASHGVSFSPGTPANPGAMSSGSNELYHPVADPSPAPDSSSVFAGAAGITNYGSSPELPHPSRFEHDTKGLASALEATGRNESSHVHRADQPDETENLPSPKIS